MQFYKLFNVVSMATAKLEHILPCYEIHFGQFYIHPLYLRNTKNVIFILSWMQLQFIMFTDFHWLNVSYIASYHSNGMFNTSKPHCFPSIGHITLCMGQNTIEILQDTLK